MSIKTRISILSVSLLILSAVTVLVSNVVLFSNDAEANIEMRLEKAESVIAERIVSLQAEMRTASLYIASDPDIAAAMESGDYEALLSEATRMFNQTGATFCTITDASGIAIARPHNPSAVGDSVIAMPSVASALSGRALTTIEPGATVRMSVCSATPVYSDSGVLLGSVVAGYRLDTDAFVDSLGQMLNCEVTFFLEDERVATTLMEANGNRLTGTKADSTISSIVLAGSTYSGRAKVLGHDTIVRYTPVTDAGGKVLGMAFVGIYLDEMTAVIWSFVTSALIIVIVVIIIGIAVSMMYARKILKPLNILTDDAERIAIGDIEIEGLDSGTSPTHDEVIKLERAFSHMLESFKKQAYVLARIAEGDYTSKVHVRSEKDVINLAMDLVLDSTLDALHKVAESGMQVSTGSRQIAESAQALAQGATEQAAAVEELSTSLSVIADKTKDNATMAGKAAMLANAIKENAEKGSVQMSEMMDAVRDINQASHSISKVIKVIDEIAFQTNILALNAAVEAARAGQHGKGFAVVAEEVRNLAAKSAEAAKDTGGLISNSIEKAELGSRIASDTSASLADIVSGIQESARIVNDIAASSVEQSQGIEQINIGINQVVEVVYQNSATAEESAAASEEMNSQADMLDDLIRQFQLREGEKKWK
ncbi:MAG: methyl-accepting chemotaxis protein [Oscillospiraceae bacterium]|nr:methyl-accepting chemotaxis protein [Oscillospiraceae bacterium]